MQLRSFEVQGLFHRYTHRISFPISKPGEPRPSLVILHGPNGVGKTTVLRMIDGLLRLDFDVFRENPFSSCCLRFTSGPCIEVKPRLKKKRPVSLDVSFEREKVTLHPRHPGPLHDADTDKVEKFRNNFSTARESLVFDFIDTSRIVRQRPPDDEESVRIRYMEEAALRERRPLNPKALVQDEPLSLSQRVARFINEAQVYHRRFFETTQTNLFTKILQRLTAKTAPRPTIKELMTTLRNIQKQDHKFRKLGLELDDWNYRQIANLVRQAGDRAAIENVSNALSSFVEVLESRAHERALVAERLETFVRIMGEFFHDKSVTLSARAGLRITTKAPAKRVLKEHQLSTGEYHLLYLMVAALVTQRRGTVIAIDEPEMSMHLAWQRRLIKALFECASKAEPQFIFATHSPDIAADFPEALVKVGG